MNTLCEGARGTLTGLELLSTWEITYLDHFRGEHKLRAPQLLGPQPHSWEYGRSAARDDYATFGLGRITVVLVGERGGAVTNHAPPASLRSYLHDARKVGPGEVQA